MTPSKLNYFIITLNSVACFILSFLVVHLLFQFATMGASAIFNIPTTLFLNKISYNTSPESWTFDSVKVIFSAGNILLFILVITFIVIYLKALEFNGLLRLFVLWGFINSLGKLLGSMIIGAFSFEGFGIVMSYLYLTDTTKMIILFSGIIILFFIGFLMVKPMLFSANIYFNYLHSDFRVGFINFQFLFPYLISTIILILYRMPLSLYEILLMIMPLFILLPLYWGTSRLPAFYFDENKIKISLRLFLILVTILFLVGLRIILEMGINFLGN